MTEKTLETHCAYLEASCACFHGAYQEVPLKKLVKSPFQYNHSASLKTHYGIDHILKIYLKQTKNNNKQTGHLLNTHSKPKRLIFQTARNYYICKFHMTDKNVQVCLRTAKTDAFLQTERLVAYLAWQNRRVKSDQVL